MTPGTQSEGFVTGLQWKQMMRAGARALELRKQEVDSLNVFPVPDGDTGTNMHLTIQSASKDAEKTVGESVSEVAHAASMGSLMGARGNSGVILSQLLRGIAKGLDGHKRVNATQIAQALQIGVDTAYKAVMKPVEGTILTVSKEVARGALNRAKAGGTPKETLQEGFRKGQQALAKTPDMLPTLKQAGVVDAGGQGFLIILGGWISVLEGSDIGLDFLEAKHLSEPEVKVEKNFLLVDNLEYPYCTEFLVKGKDLRADQIRQDLVGRGDSLLVVGTNEVIKIHIHTKNPGKVLDYALQWGSLHEVQIHNMLEQNEAIAHVLKEGNKTEAEQINQQLINKENGIVAVAMGEGIAQVFLSLGADEVIFGGQTMNPSTEDLVEAVKRIPAKNIYILPNNGNIVMAARQVKDVVTDKEIFVIPTKSIPQGISALVNFSPEGEANENVQNMDRSLSQVGSGEVTYAVRDSQFGEIDIKAGDILGLVEDKIVTTGKDILAVAKDTLEKMNWRSHDLITIFYGQEIEEEQAFLLEKWLKGEIPGIEVEVHPGKQPLYYYIFGVE